MVLNIRPFMALLVGATLSLSSAIAAAQTTRADDNKAIALPATQPTTQPTTEPSAEMAGGRTLPSVPNATLCTVLGWAKQTKQHPVSQQILAAGDTGDGPSKRATSGQGDSEKGVCDPLRLMRPISSIADVEGLNSTDLIEGVFRACSREDYLDFAERKDRPLIVNWIEDYPKILAEQCKHWNVPAGAVAAASLPQFDLSVIKPKTENEFEFRRWEQDYQKLELLRNEAFSRNMHVGPAAGWKQPVLFVMRAKLAKYDFQEHRFELKTPLVHGAASLKEYFSAPGEAFDASVVLMAGGRRCETVYMPLDEAPAEKLANEKADVILLTEGYVYYPNKQLAASSDVGPARSIFMSVSKVTVIAVPASAPLYQVAVFETGAKAGSH